ncbi:YqaA family protein [Porphyromonas sp.]|uniref:YqaA family protein n=1 Tax=Porphyromonas sp. TaxID=1924944 RepID=UPI0026DAD21F|nr:VTT domain-containing protein [Porphyromonas sp.]MDO4770773.1 VTT domain-containing protein [Porphyromonas sp.]
MEILIEYGYIGVFIAAFLAATILPFSSEIVLSGVLLTGASYPLCIAAATLGNWLGGMTCYWLGLLGKKEWIIKYLKLKEEKLDKVTSWLQKKGTWMAFFVFLPGIGDFFAVALGLLRANVWAVAAFMLAGKLFRYLVWVKAVDLILSLF